MLAGAAAATVIDLTVYCMLQGDALVTYDVHSGDAAFGAERLVRMQISNFSPAHVLSCVDHPTSFTKRDIKI